ncbi:MAG: hypothetical protein ACI8W0_000813 [Flavobacterium sp.]|jgi:hypothetical protein
MTSEWIANYDDNLITITNNWFSGEKLFINAKLQDEQLNFFTPSKMSGILTGKNGERLNVKTNISGFFTTSCRLFVDHKKVEMKQVK